MINQPHQSEAMSLSHEEQFTLNQLAAVNQAQPERLTASQRELLATLLERQSDYQARFEQAKNDSDDGNADREAA